MADTLARMLTGMRKHRIEKEYAIQTVARLLGWNGISDDNSFPAAGWRALGHGFNLPPDTDWICADPVHLRLDINNAVLWGGDRMNIHMDEARVLIDALESMFSDEGWHFHIGSTNEWYLQTPLGKAPDGPMLPEVIGKSFRGIPGKNIKDPKWATRLTEIQMMLNEHPINKNREGQGELAINSLWYWGRSNGDVNLRNPSHARIIGENHILNGLAKAAGITCEPEDPDELMKTSQDDVLIFLDDLSELAAYDDLPAWEKALTKMETNWFSYLEKLLDSGEVASIDLLSDGFQWHISKKGILRRLQTPKKLAQLLSNH